MKRNNIKSAKGFTLVEMLGVLAIIAILISVISVGVLAAINRARIVSTISNFKNLETALLAYIALPESAGQIPLTKGTATEVASASTMANNAAMSNLTVAQQNNAAMETVFLAAGTLERWPNWRVGRDGVQANVVQLANVAGWNRNRKGFVVGFNSNNVAITAANLVNFNAAGNAVVRTECAPVDSAILNPGTYNANGTMSAGSRVNFKLDGVSTLPNGTRCAYVVVPGMSMNDAAKLSEELNGSMNVIDLKQNASLATRNQTTGRFVVEGMVNQGGTVTAYYFLANL